MAPRRKMRRRLAVAAAAIFAIALVAVLWGVWAGDRIEPPLTASVSELPVSEPTMLCIGDVSSDCRSAASVEQILRSPDLEPQMAAVPSSGTQGAFVLSLETDDGAHVRAKWRAHEDDFVNDPAKELAAYETQKLFLDPSEHVIPPTASHCFAPDELAEATGLAHWDPLPGTECVLGYLSYWLTDAIGMDEARLTGHVASGKPGDRDPMLYSPDRFDSDPTYRRNIANLNALMVLVANGDLHAGQFVYYPHADHWFVVDSSIAFDSWHNPTLLFVQDLSRLHVPAIPSELAHRLRTIERAELDTLLVLAEHALEDGMLVPTAPSAHPIGDPHARIRRAGDRIQIGLTPAELAALWFRIGRLRARLDNGTLRTF